MSLVGEGFRLTEVGHLLHQPEPARVFLAHPPQVGAAAVELRQGRPPTEAVFQGLVLARDAVAVERLEEVEKLKLVVDVAARRQGQPARLDLAREFGELLVAAADASERLRFVQEAVVVADEVEHHQALLAFGFAQATAELLKEEDLRLGRAQHQHGVDCRQVDPLVEQVDREDHLQPAVGELFQRFAARQGRASVDRGGFDVVELKLPGHEFGVADGDAEGEGALLGALAPLLERMAGAGEGGELVGQPFRVETAVAPRDFAVVHRLVPDAVVVEGCEQCGFDSREQVAGEDQVVVA